MISRPRPCATFATAALALGIFWSAPRTSAPPPQVRVTAPGPVVRGCEIISDDELIALLRDRPPLVLPRENGAKTIVVLGH